MIGTTPSVGRPLRIAVVGGSDTKSGGAGRVAVDLAKVLNEAGHHATHFLGRAEQGYTQHRRSLYGGRRTTAVAHWTERKVERLGLRHILPLDAPALLAARVRRDFDVLHFHDLGEGMSPLTIAAFSRLMPTFWTFHDCSPFTGGCLNPMDCERFKTRCGTDGGCPQFGEWPVVGLYNLVGPLQAMRVFAHRAGRIRIIAPSAWLAEFGFASGKLPERPHVIPNGVDVATFTPAPDRAALRRELGLPLDQPIILLSAARMADRKKGMDHALAAIRAILDLRPFVLIVGNGNPALDAALEGIPHRITGFITNRTELARWYSAADLLLNCTLAEVLPLVVLETMACGVPTVGFGVGGVPEIVEQGRNGFLVPPLDMPALIGVLRHALEPGVAEAWGRAARPHVEENFSSQKFLERHIAYYRQHVTVN